MVPSVISHYEILEKLGEGGMGVVFKARDTRLDRIVALKFLPHQLTPDESDRARFLQEAKAAAALNHNNICTIYGVDESDGTMFIAMEFIEGGTLREKIPFAKVDDALTVAIQIGEALQEAHAKGIVHRDVKSDNVMLTSKGQVKVMDFGLAKLKGSLKLTKTSSTIGTLGYMAPEQIQGREADSRSDIFSFGVLLYEMLSGSLPFRGEHEAAMLYAIVNEEPAPIQQYLPEVSSELSHILDKALEKDPEDRYQTVQDMVIDLRRLKKITSRVSRPLPRPTSVPGSREQPTPAPRDVPNVPGRDLKSLLWPAIGVVLALVAVGVYLLFFRREEALSSIAVLPFVNSSGDPNSEYLSDGITEQIINSLSRVTDLRVLPRSSVFYYKGKNRDPIALGRELGLRSVLSGRLLIREKSLNVQAELIDVQKGSQLWGDQYTRGLADVEAIQEEIAKAVTGALRVRLTSGEKAGLSQRGTLSSEAYELYLKGRFHWNKRGQEGYRKAIEYFNEAIQRDPNYALAYSGLADSYSLLGDWGYLSAKEAYPKAKEAALRALSLDESLPEAHTSLAFITEEFDWDWSAAEKEFKRAIELNPSYDLAHHMYAYYLMQVNRTADAIAEITLAQQKDPLSLPVNRSVGQILYYARRYDQSIEQLHKTLEMDKNFYPVHFNLYDVLRQEGLYEKAVEEYLEGMTAGGDKIERISALKDAYAKAGWRGFCRMNLGLLFAQMKNEYVPPYFIAEQYAYLGDRDSAFVWIQKSYEEREEINPVNPQWDPIRSDPRFQALLRHMNLPGQ